MAGESLGLCPFLSTPQVVPFTFKAVAKPAHVEAGFKRDAASGLDMGDLKSGKLAGVPREIPVVMTTYAVEGGMGYRTGEGSTQEEPNLVPETLTVSCLGHKCQGWSKSRQDCGYKHPE